LRLSWLLLALGRRARELAPLVAGKLYHCVQSCKPSWFGRSATSSNSPILSNCNARVGLKRRRERFLNRDMDLGRRYAVCAEGAEPNAAPCFQVLGLLNLGHSEFLGVEAASVVLAGAGTP
jgi:hypothetical protein